MLFTEPADERSVLPQNADFLSEGRRFGSFYFPGRIVIGADCQRRQIHRPLTDGSYYERRAHLGVQNTPAPHINIA